MLEVSTELDAVNIVLDNIGETAVNTLTGSLPIDASKARSVLAEVSRSVQTKGWHFNTEYRTMPPNGDGEIVFGSDVVKADTYGSSSTINVVLRGRKLFNRNEGENTTVFTDNVKVVVVKLLDFADLPEAARYFITIRAARIHQQRSLGAESISGFNAQDESIAWTQLRAHDEEQADHNMLTGSGVVNDIVQRRYFTGGYV